MARPGQNASRKRAREDDEGNGDGNVRINGPVLPVADVPDDFDGEAQDGATFLALAMYANLSSSPFGGSDVKITPVGGVKRPT